MFQGGAEGDRPLQPVFERFRLMQVQHYDPTPDGRRLIKHATIDFDRQNLVFIDSPISHDFSFTPAVSLFINLPNEEALERAFHRLAEGGKVLMPLDDYGFSARFGWLNDRFGLSGSSMCRRGSEVMEKVAFIPYPLAVVYRYAKRTITRVCICKRMNHFGRK
ncbi:VOC family protein [Serratia ureilytica]